MIEMRIHKPDGRIEARHANGSFWITGADGQGEATLFPSNDQLIQIRQSIDQYFSEDGSSRGTQEQPEELAF